MGRIRHVNLRSSPACPVEGTLEIIGGKWKGVILYHLMSGTLRFSELRRRIRNVTQRMLTNQLRELEANGLIARTVYAEVPPRVEYALTDLGRTLQPIILALKAWGDANIDIMAPPLETEPTAGAPPDRSPPAPRPPAP